MSFTIETLNGVRYDLDKLGVIPIAFDIDSPFPRHAMEVVEGRDGYLDLGTDLDGRTIKVSFLIQVKDDYDYSLLRDEMFRLFDARTIFYLIEKEEPRKRWKVKTAAAFTPKRIGEEYGKIEIQLISPSAYAESVGTTLDPLTFDAEKWQVGQGLTLEEPKYVHSTTNFKIFNTGDITVDPRQFELKIIYRGASDKLRIKNETTGDEWTHDGISEVSDQITLDGVRSLKNSASIFGKTNRRLLKLSPGWNTISLSGTKGSFLISFDFRFYYL